MEYEQIPYVNKKVSRLFYGTCTDALMAGKDGSYIFDAALEAGINAFDLARVYRGAEGAFGKWLKTRNRDDVVILSKCAHPGLFVKNRVTEKCIRSDYEKTRRDLGTDYIDIYLLHRDNLGSDISVGIETLNAMHAEGKIGAFGVSNWTHERIQTANEYAYKHNLIPYTVSSPHFGLARQINEPWGGGSVSLTGPENAAARKWYAENGMTIVAYSPLGRGVMTGRIKSTDASARGVDRASNKGYFGNENLERIARCEELCAKYNATVPQLALAWIFKQNLNCFPAVSTMSIANLKKNVAALDIPLTDDDAKYLNLEENAIIRS